MRELRKAFLLSEKESGCSEVFGDGYGTEWWDWPGEGTTRLVTRGDKERERGPRSRDESCDRLMRRSEEEELVVVAGNVGDREERWECTVVLLGSKWGLAGGRKVFEREARR